MFGSGKSGQGHSKGEIRSTQATKSKVDATGREGLRAHKASPQKAESRSPRPVLADVGIDRKTRIAISKSPASQPGSGRPRLRAAVDGFANWPMKIRALDLESVMPAHLHPWHVQTPEDDCAQGETEFKRERCDRAVAAWLRSAASGHVEAQFRLGECYTRGAGVMSSLADAALWFKRAAQAGHREAQ